MTNIGYVVRAAEACAGGGRRGGRDVLSALAFRAQSVTAVEINKDIIRTVNGRFGDFTGHLDRDPESAFVNDEARSFIARSPDRFDSIQISLIDTWAATAAGASSSARTPSTPWRHGRTFFDPSDGRRPSERLTLVLPRSTGGAVSHHHDRGGRAAIEKGCASRGSTSRSSGTCTSRTAAPRSPMALARCS